MKASPHLRTIALIVLFSTAGAGLLDYLLKWHVTIEIGRGPHLFRFFAIFYGAVQLVTFLAQSGSARTLQRLGIGSAISTLPAGAGVTSALALESSAGRHPSGTAPVRSMNGLFVSALS